MFENILIPLDFTEKNDPAIAIARQMASAGEARLRLLHVIKAIEGVPDQDLNDFYEMLEDRAHVALTRLQVDLENQGLEADTIVVFGKRPEEIVRFAEKKDFDLIIMSSRQLDPEMPMRPWPTISHKVGVLAPCPVLLVR